MNLTVTADFACLRFHGLKGGYLRDYEPSELKPWADHIRNMARQDISVYAYFNNDGNSRAPKNARELTQMIHPSLADSVAKVE